MSARAAFRQEDVKRAVRGCIAGGLAVATVRVLPGGAIEVYALGPDGQHATHANPLDRLLNEETS